MIKWKGGILMTESEFEDSFRSVSMVHEMYNDGLYFVDQAMKETHFGDKHRCYRFAIVSFASSFESFINTLIRHALFNKSNRTQKEDDILDYLENGFAQGKDFPEELSSVKRKLNLLGGLYQINKSLSSTYEFKKFNMQIIQLRNAIVHYSHGNFSEVYEQRIISAANEGAQLLREVIKMFETKLNLPNFSYFDKKTYEPIN